MIILGISSFYHDSAAAIVRDGEIVAAAQEERFTRIKHDSSFPENAIKFCLLEARIDLEDVDDIAFYDKPFLKFERLLENYLSLAPSGFKSFSMALPLWIKEKLFQKKLILDELKKLNKGIKPEINLLFSEHHQSHAASAFYPSPFEEAVVLTMDGVGEWATTSVSIGRGNKLEVLKEIHFPHSIGLLYSAFTYYTGFKVNSGEYKVMGLAPYGEPRYVSHIYDHLIDVKSDGSFRMNMNYFDYCGGLTMTNQTFHQLFDGPPRSSKEKLTQKHMDLASSVQKVVEDIVVKITRSLARETGQKYLCLAGGVALNCVANGVIKRDGRFEDVWVQPASGDAGGSIGAALAAYYWHHDNRRVPSKAMDGMKGGYLGPTFTQKEIESCLTKLGAKYKVLAEDKLIETVAKVLSEDSAVGWFQGRMEFGPRALGGRSILGNPLSKEMQRTLNLKVKYRESFRPFAPSILASETKNWFEHDAISPYMLMVAPILEKHRVEMSEEERDLFGIEKLNVVRSNVPAITHVDYSARLQTIHSETNRRYHDLVTAFFEITGCPMVINTSFNVRGEPIVCTPEDAFKCFMGTELDYLAIGDCLLHKQEQNPELKLNYQDAFELD